MNIDALYISEFFMFNLAIICMLTWLLKQAMGFVKGMIREAVKSKDGD